MNLDTAFYMITLVSSLLLILSALIVLPTHTVLKRNQTSDVYWSKDREVSNRKDMTVWHALESKSSNNSMPQIQSPA